MLSCLFLKYDPAGSYTVITDGVMYRAEISGRGWSGKEEEYLNAECGPYP